MPNYASSFAIELKKLYANDRSQLLVKQTCLLRITVADTGEAPPLFLDQTEARRAQKRFFGDRPLPHPAPTFSQGLDPALHYIKLSVSAFFKFAHPRLLLYFLCYLSLCVIF